MRVSLGESVDSIHKIRRNSFTNGTDLVLEFKSLTDSPQEGKIILITNKSYGFGFGMT